MRLNNLFDKRPNVTNFQQRFIACFFTNKQSHPNDSLIELNVEF